MKRVGFLVLMGMVGLFAFRSASAASYIENMVTTTGDPKVQGNFYGYKSSSQGPGNDAFQKCLKAAEDLHRPFVWIWGKDSCSSCSSFAEAINAFTIMRPKQSTWNIIPGYFRGNDSGTGPQACAEARAFFDDPRMTQNGARVSGSCHLVGFYGVFEDGTVMSRSALLPVTSMYNATINAYIDLVEGWVNAFDTQAKNHKYTAPKGSSGFACGTTEMTRLESVTNGAETVYVPMVRTNNLANVEKNWLRVTYPDSTTTNIAFTWAAKGPTATNLEIAVDVSAVAKVGDKVRLEYLNTNQVSLATNWITCVTAKNGTLMSPWLPGAKASGDLAWGEWTLDFAAATNRVAQEGGCTLAILGSPVWSKTAYDIFGASGDAFVKDCATNKVMLAVVDVEDAAGASLFSHRIAATGRSGTPFLSRNGLCTTNEDVKAMKAALASVDAAYRKADVGTAEFILIRADGSVAGRLSPYVGAASDTENTYRILELSQLMADPNEEANDDPATTEMALAYGVESPTNTLHVSDRKDVFLLTNVPAGEPVGISLGKNRTLEGADVTLTVVTFTNPKDRSQYREVNPALPGVWVFSAAEKASLGVIVSAWKDGTGNLLYHGDSTIQYAIKAVPAPEDVGEISFVKKSDTVLINDGLDYSFAVERTGYTGAASVKIDIDEELTTATNECYVWNGPVTVTWDENSWGTSNLTVKLIPTGDFSGDGDIVFRASACTGADFAGTNLFRLSVSQKPTENVGMLSIADPDVTGGTLYLPEGSNVTVRLHRDGNHDGTQYGWLTSSDGKLSTNVVEWIDYDMADKTAVWTLPTLGTASKMQKVRLTLLGLDGAPVTNNALSVCVLPADAPVFMTNRLSISAIQYAALGKNDENGKRILPQVGLVELPAGWTVRYLRNVSGSLPSGLSLDFDANGTISLSGATSGTQGGDSTWWLELERTDGSATYSYPVTISVDVSPLADANPWFAVSRTWTGLPIVLARGTDPINLQGTLDLTIAKNGKTSAKYRTLGNRTISFAADGITEIDPNGTAYIQIRPMTEDGEWWLEVTLWPGTAGSAHATMDMEVSVTDPALPLSVTSGYISGYGEVNWSAETEDEIKPWAGIYSMAFPAEGTLGANTLCSGSPSVQVRFTSESQWRIGRTIYAGVLPNGRTFSGSATFTPAAEGFTELGLGMLTTSAADDFAAAVSITNAGEKGMLVGRAIIPSLWNHTERGFPLLSYSNVYAAVGSRFTATNEWEKVWGKDSLAFEIDGEKMTDVHLVPDGWRIKSDNREALSTALNRNSGAMTGVFRDEHSYQWKGTAMPGCEAFLLGAYWYNFSTTVTNAVGREMHKSVRCGGSVRAAVE